MIPYSRPKLSDLLTLSQSKPLENRTLRSGTYLYSQYMVAPMIPGNDFNSELTQNSNVLVNSLFTCKNFRFTFLLR